MGVHSGAPVEEIRLAELAERFPQAPVGELRRFLQNRRSVDDAAKAYSSYLAWRQGQGAPARLAAAAAAVPARWIRPAGLALDGTRLVLLQGARYDASVPAEEYALACGAALDQAAPGEGTAKVTILVDLRPGQGWANTSPGKMLSFMKLAAKILPNHFPDRGERYILYPITPIVKYFWSMVSGLVDKATRDQFVMLSGSASLGAPCPPELADYVTLDELPPDAHAMHAGLPSRPASPPQPCAAAGPPPPDAARAVALVNGAPAPDDKQPAPPVPAKVALDQYAGAISPPPAIKHTTLPPRRPRMIISL